VIGEQQQINAIALRFERRTWVPWRRLGRDPLGKPLQFCRWGRSELLSKLWMACPESGLDCFNADASVRQGVYLRSMAGSMVRTGGGAVGGYRARPTAANSASDFPRMRSDNHLPKRAAVG
jgi:hypothetical protein